MKYVQRYITKFSSILAPFLLRSSKSFKNTGNSVKDVLIYFLVVKVDTKVCWSVLSFCWLKSLKNACDSIEDVLVDLFVVETNTQVSRCVLSGLEKSVSKVLKGVLEQWECKGGRSETDTSDDG